MGIPTLELHPGVGLGPFSLGTPICDTLAQVEQHESVFESTVIKYCEQDPLSWDIVIAFPHLGFHLCFDPRTQRLYKLEVYDVSRVHLRYASSIIGGPSTPATFARIYSVLGPTFPGAYKQTSGTYTLSYPGLSLLFRIPPRYAACCMQSKEMPLEFPDGTTPVVSRISLHMGELSSAPVPHDGVLSDSASAAGKGLSPLSLAKQLPPLLLPSGGVYMEEVQVRLGDSIFFTAGQQRICFGFSPQDVWSELGRPCSIVQRESGTMLMHLPSSRTGQQLVSHAALQSAPQHESKGDFAWSYFTRGIDVVFDADTRTVKKFVLHTNAPGHADFNEYVKCNFVIASPGTPGLRQAPSSRAAQDAVTADSKWEDVQRVLGGGSRGAIQTSGSLLIAFGPTFVYGLKDATFEVMRNGHISTVTLFQTPAD